MPRVMCVYLCFTLHVVVRRRRLLRHLGFMVTSTFMERMFSIAKQVWNKASQSQSTARFEMRSVLRGGKKALGQLQAAGATTS